MHHRGIYSNIPAFHINHVQEEVGAVQQRGECVCVEVCVCVCVGDVAES